MDGTWRPAGDVCGSHMLLGRASQPAQQGTLRLRWVQSCQEWLAWPLGKLCQMKQNGQNEKTSPTPVPTQRV